MRDTMGSEIDFIKEAVAGDRDSQFKLAQMYRDGNTVSQDYKKAIKWFNSAADQGHVRAKYELAMLFEKCGTAKEKKKISKLIDEAAIAGDKDALLHKARVCKDLEQSKKYYLKSMNLGSKRAKLELAEIFYRSEDEIERLDSVRMCYELALEGDRDAMFRLYLQYRYAVGTRKDIAIAKYWCEKSADAGHLSAKKEFEDLILPQPVSKPYNIDTMFKMARACRDGKTDGGIVEAERLYRICSDAGMDRAKLELAEILYKGDSRVGKRESIRMCYELSNKGNKDAMFRLYLHYRYGVGVKPNHELAKEWLQKAIDAGHQGALKEEY